MPSLYEIDGQYLQLLQMFEDGDIDEETLKDTLETIDMALEDKADNIAFILKEFDGQIDYIKAEEKRLADRRKFVEKQRDILKERLHHSFVVADKKKIKTNLHSYSVCKTAGSLIIDDEKTVPEQYFVPQAPKLDKETLKKDVKAGLVEMDGIYIKQGSYLRIS